MTSDAEATIRSSIISAIAEGRYHTVEHKADIIMGNIFDKPVRWAVVAYLEEVESGVEQDGNHGQ
jgi:hypothetical protein